MRPGKVFLRWQKGMSPVFGLLCLRETCGGGAGEGCGATLLLHPISCNLEDILGAQRQASCLHTSFSVW